MRWSPRSGSVPVDLGLVIASPARGDPVQIGSPSLIKRSMTDPGVSPCMHAWARLGGQTGSQQGLHGTGCTRTRCRWPRAWLRATLVGPKKAYSGIPAQDSTCIGPESLVTAKRARRPSSASPRTEKASARIDTDFLRQRSIERPVFSRADPDDPHTAPFHSGGECDVMRPALALPTTAAPGVKQGEPSVPEPVGLAPA